VSSRRSGRCRCIGEAVGAEGLGGLVRGRAGLQAAGFEDRGEVEKRVLAGRVELECELDELGAFGVDRDGADFAAVDPLARVEVADRRLERGAAFLGLLGGALHDLGCEVAAVELRDARHDPVQEQAGRGFVDVLGGGDELGA
jgi:hypothetical protein